jgi:basic amino acid/polyamine antiporter, APA family
VTVKISLVVVFAALGLGAGAVGWPAWQAPADGGVRVFLENQYWVAFAFSGWNAAIYAASEFRDPARQVPRAMRWGCLAVTALYLLVNWVFVSNLTPVDALAVTTDADRVPLGPLVVARLYGPAAAGAVSLVAVLVFASAMSAMTLVGPRVVAAMARDGFLPGALAGRNGRPPVGAVLLQGGVAVALLWTVSLHDIVGSAAAILLLFTGLTTASLFALSRRRPDLPPPSRGSLAAAAVYTVVSAAFLVFGFHDDGLLLLGLLGVGLLGVGAWALTPRRGAVPAGK